MQRRARYNHFQEEVVVAILGAHLSIAGGYHRAVHQAREFGCDCVQLFTKNNAQWGVKEITWEQSRQFRDALEELAVSHPLAHSSYLINLASPDEGLWRKSVDAFAAELQRAETLGIPFVVIHPGCHTNTTPEHGVLRVIEAIDLVHAQTRGLKAKCLVETTAGQGTALGWKFEQLAAILDGVQDADRLGICFDTCHVFAAGYALRTSRDYQRTFQLFDSVVGLGRIKAFHLNDSARDRGSRVRSACPYWAGQDGAGSIPPHPHRSPLSIGSDVPGDS